MTKIKEELNALFVKAGKMNVGLENPNAMTSAFVIAVGDQTRMDGILNMNQN